MKKILLLGISLLGLAACEKEGDGIQNYEEKHKLTIRFASEAQQETKASGANFEQDIKDNKINSLHVLIFRNDASGAFEDKSNYSFTTGSPSGKLTIETTAGPKMIFAIANADEVMWKGVTNLSEFKTKIASLKNESHQNFQMVGKKEITISGKTDITMKLSRLVSRIVLTKVAANFNGTPLQGKSLENPKIYLINVKGTKKIHDNSDPSSDNFLCKGKYSSIDYGGAKEAVMFYEAIPGPIGVMGHDTEHYFYCYENTVEGHSESAPATKLVIEGTIAGKTYYYPIDINQTGFGHMTATGHFGVKSNHSYSMNVTIKRLGSTDPDTPLKYGDIDLSLNVESWNVVPETEIVF